MSTAPTAVALRIEAMSGADVRLRRLPLILLDRLILSLVLVAGLID